MRRRALLTLDTTTGEMTYREETLDQDATVEQRFAEMEEVADDSAVMFMAVVCNGCGLSIPVDRPGLPPGWCSVPEGEFCPDCKETP